MVVTLAALVIKNLSVDAIVAATVIITRSLRYARRGNLICVWLQISIGSVLNGQSSRDRVRAPPHAAVRGGVPSVCLPLDEQPLDEGAAIALHNQTVGHLPGTHT